MKHPSGPRRSLLLSACALCIAALPLFAAAATPVPSDQVEGPPAPSLSRFDLLKRLARSAANRRDWKTAAQHFQKALELKPNDDDLRKEFAGVLFQAGNPARALEAYDRILARSPRRKDVQDEAVNVCMAVRNFPAMLARLEAYSPGRENDRAFTLRLARAYAWTNKPSRAARIYAGLVRQDPDDRVAYTEYLNALLAAGIWEEFADESARFVGKWPDDRKVPLFRIDALLLQDRIPEALELLERLTRIPEKAPVGVWLRASDLHLALGRTPGEVAAMLEDAVRGRKAPELRARLAVVHGYDGTFHKSFANLEAARRDGASPDLLLATRAEILALGRMHRTALDLLKRLARGDGATVRALKDTATSAAAVRRYGQAKAALRRAVILFPGDLDARFRYVRLLEKRSETGEALRIINAVVKKRPSNPTARLLRGRVLAAAARPEEGAADLSAVSDILAEYGAERTVRNGLMSKQYLDLVPAAVWRDVTGRDPEDLSARARLAAALYREGRLAVAAEEWEKLIAADPDQPAFRLGLAETLVAQGIAADPERRQQVNSEVERLLAAEGSERPALTRLAELLVRLDRWADLEGVAARLLQKQPDNGHVVGLLAGALLALGREEEARAAIEKYLAREPANIVSAVTLWVRLGSLGRGTDDRAYRIAMAGLDRTVEENPKNPDILLEAGRMAAAHRHYDTGRERLQAVLEVLPRDSAALLWRARLESWDRRYDTAVEFYGRYEKVHPDDPRALLERARTLGWALRYNQSHREYTRGMERFADLGQPRAGGVSWAETLRLERDAKWWNWNFRERTAAELYDRLLALRPDDAEIRFERGQMDTRLNFSRRAIDAYKRTLLLAPGHNQAREALAAEEARLRPYLLQAYRFREEKGFSDLFEITEHLITTTVWSREIGEMWWFGLESEEAFYHFDEFPDPFARRARIMARKRLYSGLQLDAWVRRSWYTKPDHSTTNLALEARYKAFDRVETLVGFDRQDVIENYRTLARDIQRDRLRVALGSDLTRRLRVDAQGALVHYDDDNDGVRAGAGIAFKLLHYPRILKLAYNVEYWDFPHQDRVYFSPEEYVQHGPSIHWRHYLDPHPYHGGKERYYGIKIPVKVDNNGELYRGLELEFLWDITLRWQIGTDASFTLSRPYDATFVRAWMRWRL